MAPASRPEKAAEEHGTGAIGRRPIRGGNRMIRISNITAAIGCRDTGEAGGALLPGGQVGVTAAERATA